MPKVIAVLGMPGAGKTEVVKILVDMGFQRVYFGDVTFDEMKKKGLEINEKNERTTRERIRKEYGDDAYAKIILPKVQSSIKSGKNVVLESMYSYAEYNFLKNIFGKDFFTISIAASKRIRHDRLAKRRERPLTEEEAESRDIAQVENLNTGQPIALADFTIVNEGSLAELREKINKIIEEIGCK